MDNHIVSFENVGIRYQNGPEILSNINFNLQTGSFHFLTGASGAGKSTLLRLMYTGIKATRGIVKVFGYDIAHIEQKHVPLIRQRVGMIFQEFKLLEHLTAFENVALPLRLKGESEHKITAYVSELLAWVGLEDHIHAYPATLSGGQQQRVAIARAVITKPDLILADEPTGSVDDNIADRIMHLFEQLFLTGSTIIFATHNQRLYEASSHPRINIHNHQLTIS